MRTISRSDNHSAVAAAAYRSGSVLRDERTGQSHNYRNRKGIIDAFTGKTGSGDSTLTPSTTKKDQSSSSKEKELVKSKAQTRLALNEEIKRLNEQRAAFSPVPLKDQIKELDRLMTRLDGRVQRLKLLSEKTSLPARVLSLVKQAITVAKSLIVVRTKDEAVRLVRTAEREAKAERQRARYGTTYRASIRERMAEMRENIEILQTRKTQYYNYKSFVEMVEQRLKLVHSSLKAPALPARTEWKATTIPQTLKAKIVTEAIQKREKVPIEYKPNSKQEPLVKNFKAALVNTASPMAINNSINPTKVVLKGENSKRPEKSFTASTIAPLKDNAARAVWHKEITVKIRSLEQVRAERAPITLKEPMDSPKVWRVEANEKGKIILERMQADIRERKADMPALNTSGFSGRFNAPTKTITDQQAIQKVRTEAKAARTKVPPKFRAEFYSSEVPPKAKDGFSGSWNDTIKEERQRLKPTIGSKFNFAAGSKSNKTVTPDNKPDMKL